MQHDRNFEHQIKDNTARISALKQKLEEGTRDSEVQELYAEIRALEEGNEMMVALKNRKSNRIKEGRPSALQARRARGWVHPSTAIPMHRLHPLLSRISELESVVGDKPVHWRKPNYGQLDYIIAWRMGWISDADEKKDRAVYETRRARSLKHSHKRSLGYWRGDFEETIQHGLCETRTTPLITGGYVPELPSHMVRDQDLTDGSRRCLTILLENTYRLNRHQRWLATTVTYLMEAMGRSRRTIQNYLRQLEICGYISCEVLIGAKSRMCNGLKIVLKKLSFPKHHREKWPTKNWKPPFAENGIDGMEVKIGGIPDAQKDSLNYFTQIYYIEDVPTQSVWYWAAKCMAACFDRYMKNTVPVS